MTADGATAAPTKTGDDDPQRTPPNGRRRIWQPMRRTKLHACEHPHTSLALPVHL